MGERKLRDWTVEEFLRWEEQQPVRYELVHGQPVMMAGSTQTHDAIAINLTSTLKALLRGSRCRPGSSDLRVPIGTGHVRHPDAIIDCGEFRRNSNTASEPTVVFEILSTSTAWTDLHEKLHDYDMTPTIMQYILVSQDEPKVIVWNRGGNGRLALDETISDLAAGIAVRPVGLTLKMSDIYDGLGFEAPPPDPGR